MTIFKFLLYPRQPIKYDKIYLYWNGKINNWIIAFAFLRCGFRGHLNLQEKDTGCGVSHS